jgi:peptidoglycan/LPS O-acetylase OafA/YrhL
VNPDRTIGVSRYIPELDGLRCVAIAGVVLFHLRVPGFGLGSLGVWLFFVLSGYLITSILLYEQSAGAGFGLYAARFYARRALRIFPLYYAYLAVNYVLQRMSGHDVDGYIFYLTYTQNFLLGATQFSDIPGNLGHTWSLATEEQFYLLWPFLVYFLSRKWLTGVCLALIVAAPLFRGWAYATLGNPYLIYAFPLGSADTLAFGCLCALHWDRISKVSDYAMGGGLVASFALFFGLVASIGPWAIWDPENWTQHPAQMLYISAAGLLFATIVASAERFSWRGLLRHPAVVHIGKISYGIYIWHELAMELGNRLVAVLDPGAIGRDGVRIAVSAAVTYLVSIISYKYLETPFLRMKVRYYARKGPDHDVRRAGAYQS